MSQRPCLIRRLHIDLQRVIRAACPGATAPLATA
jgi:hypothetical protein